VKTRIKTLALVAALAWTGAPALSAAELQTADGASVTVRTRTEFDLSIDDPSRFGLATSIPELSLNFALTPWQKVGEIPRSGQPQGFLQFELDKMEIRYTNGAQPDYNAPSGSGGFTFQFNDPAKAGGKTGYFGPVYMPNMRAGIVWGDWLLQLAAAGVLDFDNPWNRAYERSYERMSADWAYLDTRVQYRRPSVEQYLTDLKASPPSETNYWSYDTTPNPFDQLNTDFSSQSAHGGLVGLEYSGKAMAARLKLNTRYTLTDLPAGQSNGIGVGTDVSFTPVRGLVSTSSVVSRWNYVGEASPNKVGLGSKLAYEVPAPGLKGLSLMPMVGYDTAFGVTGDKTMAQEASAAFTVKWPGTEGWAYDYLRDRTGTVYSGLTFAYKLLQTDVAQPGVSQEVLVTLFEDQGDEGLVKGLGSEIVVEGHDVGNPGRTATVSSYFDWTVKAGKARVIPWTRILYDWNGSAKAQMMTSLGVRLEKFIPKAVFGLTWDSNDLIPGTPQAGWGVAKLFTDISL